MFNVRLAGDKLYEKWLFTWQSLVMSLVMSCLYCLFSREMSWMRYVTVLSQFPEDFSYLLLLGLSQQ